MTSPDSPGVGPSSVSPWLAGRRGAFALYGSLLSLSLLVRLAILLAPRADLCGRPKGGPNIYYAEEIFRGDVALELQKGLLMPWQDYQYAGFFGGSLVIAPVVLFWMFVLGPRLLAIKLAPVCFHLAATFLVIRLLDRMVSRRAAWIGGLLFAASPPGYSLVTTIAWGSHIESNALAMGYLALAAGIWTKARPSPVRRFALGLLGGFSVYFGYQCLLFVVAVAVVDAARKARIGRQGIAAQLAGMAAGFAPWIWTWWHAPGAALRIYDKTFLDHLNPALAGERALTLVGKALPGAWSLPPSWGLSGTLLSFAAFGVMATLALAGLGSLFRSKGARFWLLATAGTYLGLLGAALLFTDFKIVGPENSPVGLRYTMLSAPWICLAAGIGLDRWARRPRVAALTLTAIVGLNLAGTWGRCIDPSRALADWDHPAVPVPAVPVFVGIRYQTEPERVLAYCQNLIEQRPQEEAERCLKRLGFVLRGLTRKKAARTPAGTLHVQAEGKNLRQLQRLLAAQLPTPYRRHFRENRKKPDPVAIR